ncbi:phage tail protein [Salmonella enterica subsp. enterica serovar Soerenga]|uniref:phage tail protein n=1 Tax=Salmonella enterica TaxID=28901 RepID=UPI0003BCE4F5|nr:phage tail protein [Salmonella enterica]EAO4729840.1 phage tail protein [Salmonella enterica subsp. enterica serovar Soerenga]EGZ3899914.1 phage tail protein [Salmonella enterica subsp. enterica serovar Pisa]EAP5788408.1 phage tail protein [Salmonella enterica subsp. enterica serovar Soerenga]EAR7545497.1 phage tail protein [Salmonella enterica]EAX9334155.1 phage tail protein [Salmonella enterica]
MTAKYFAILTNQGAARLANAAALGTKLNLTQMAVGDANGTLPTPDPSQTKLINQKRIAPLNLLTVDPANTSQIIAEQIIPENEGGFWIREIGLYDDDGILIAVANCPETYKPQLQEGSGRTQTIRMILVVSSTSAITLKIDPAVVLATRQYVDDKIIEVKGYADDLMKKHVEAANPHKQYPLIANALKEMVDAGLAGDVLKNLGLRASGQYTDNLLFTGPDGLKIQVFRRTLANQTTVGVINTVPVTFPVPFPVNCWGVFSTKSTWVQITNSCEWVSNTGFTAQVMMNIAVDTNTSDAMFLAIGY